MTQSRLFFLGVFLAILAAMLPARDAKPLKAVDSVDLQRYAGDWYEIARYSNRFQKDCDSDMHVRYTLQGPNKLNIRSECRNASGKPDIANGTAKVVDAKTNAKLKVTFFWPFYSDYWIIDLDPKYRFAVVGEPARKHLWILSRAKELDQETYQHILQRVAENGYDTSKLVKTRQSLATAQLVWPANPSQPLAQFDSNQRTF